MDHAVFINYRGADSHSYGALLYTELARQFGEDHVFLDAESIPAGADYVKELLARVRSARVLLAVIGPHWLTATDAAGRRRIDDSNDWIRRELAEAFAAGVRVIPILTDQADLPGIVELPADVAGLSRCQYRQLRYREPTTDLARLVADLISVEPVLALAARHRADAAHAAWVPAAMFSMRGDIPHFVGRTEELRILLDTVSAAADGSVRGIAVHTIDGMAGVGKTTFGVHAAHCLADRFPDGQVFVELCGHSPTQDPCDPAEVLASLLVATGMDRQHLPKQVHDLARLWRDRIAGKKVLLVLDDAAGHDQLRPLLPGTPECFVVITSRHRLPGLDGVHPLTLDVMAPDQATRLLLTLARRDPPSDPDAAVRVVQLCGYLPLAIALAAGRLRSHPTWSLTYLADLLDHDADRLQQLAAGDRSVRAAFTVSYQHLTPEQQQIFTLLGVHPGPGIDAYALAALADCSLDQAHDHLEALHADHLIHESAPGRYQLHDLLRIYAGSLAATADHAYTGPAMRRVLNYYLHTVAAAAAHIPAYAVPTLTITPHDPAHRPRVDTPQRARLWLDTERSTLATCLDHAAAHPDLIVALAVTLNAYLRHSSAWEQAERIHLTALAAAERTGDRLGQANTLHNLGNLYRLRGEHVRSEQLQRKAYRLYTDLGHRLGQAHALNDLGNAWQMRGDYGRAERLQRKAYRLYSDLGDRLGQASALNDLANVYLCRAEWRRAEPLLGQAHQLYTDLGHRLGEALALGNLGIVYSRRAEWGQAEQALDRAHQLYVDLGDRPLQGHTLHSLGYVYLLRGEWTRAEQMVGQAQQSWTDLGDPLAHAATLGTLGRLYCLRGDYGRAEHVLDQAHQIYTDFGNRYGQATALHDLGCIYRLRGEYSRAQQALDQAHQIYTDLGHRHGRAYTLLNLGRIHHQNGDHHQAQAFLTQAHALFADMSGRDGEAETLNSLGDLALDHPASGDPRRLFTRAVRLARAIGDPLHEADALTGLGRWRPATTRRPYRHHGVHPSVGHLPTVG